MKGKKITPLYESGECICPVLNEDSEQLFYEEYQKVSFDYSWSEFIEHEFLIFRSIVTNDGVFYLCNIDGISELICIPEKWCKFSY